MSLVFLCHTAFLKKKRKTTKNILPLFFCVIKVKCKLNGLDLRVGSQLGLLRPCIFLTSSKPY